MFCVIVYDYFKLIICNKMYDLHSKILEYTKKNELIEIHVKVDHQTTPDNGDSQRRPEKFPRPEIGLEKSTED